jgi:photosystem II stability/assembly factor-like uncharacterized protein
MTRTTSGLRGRATRRPPAARLTRRALAVALLVLAAACLPGWRQQAAFDAVALDDLACTDSTHCWAVGAQGGTAAVVATTDGSTWTRRTTGVTGAGLHGVDCAGDRCVAVGGATVLQSADAGASWTARPLASAADLADVACTAAGRCVAAGRAGDDGVLATSPDGGVTWSPVALPALAGLPLAGVDCAAAGCLAVGAPRTGVALWSADGGVTWTARPGLGGGFPGGYDWGVEFHAVDCLPTVCFAVGMSFFRYGAQPVVYRTTDGGATWESQGLAGGTGTVPDTVSCADADHCWVGGRSDSLSTIWATGSASSPAGPGWYGEFTGIEGAHTVTGLACTTSDRCKAVASTPSGSRVFDTANGGVAVPVVTGMTPDRGPSAGGGTVTLTGHGLAGATAVRFGAAESPSFRAEADDRLVATVPPGDPGEPFATVSVVTPDGTATSATTYLHEFPLHLTAMTPDRCAFGADWACDILRFQGTGIPPNYSRQDAARVRFGPVDVVPDCQSTTECYIVIPRAAEHPELVDTVVPVTFATGGGSQTFPFTYGPVVSAISPGEGPATGGPVTITGIGLRGVTAVRFAGRPATCTVVDDTRLTATVPPGPADTRVGLELTNALGDWVLGTGAPAGEPWDGAVFTHQGPPTITELRPPYGSADSMIELHGDHLGAVERPRAVWFGTVASPEAYCNQGTCWAAVPPGSGTVPVRIETGGGTSPVTPATMFTYYPRPEVRAMTPSSGPAAGGNTAVITGANLADVLRVGIGGIDATIVSITPTAVTVVVPPGSPGEVAWVGLETRGGPSLGDVMYTYT